MTTAGPSHATVNPQHGASNRVTDDGGGEAAEAKQPGSVPIQVLFDQTLLLLNNRDFQSADPRTFKGLTKRLRMMAEAGIPRMKLLPGKVLEELGRIPRSTEMREDGEPYTVDALDVIELGGVDHFSHSKCIIAFFSHRWLQANYSTLHQRDVEWGSAEWKEAAQADGHYVGKPDNEDNDKARDLIEWMRWFKWKTSHRRYKLERKVFSQFFSGFMEDYVAPNCSDVYFFIDWACVDQTDPVAEIAALPAFVSSCSMIASYWTEEYHGRAWCQAELLMARAFCALTVVMRVPQGFKHEEQKHVTSEQVLLPDPANEATAKITDEKDRETIRGLTNCAQQSRAFTYSQCTNNIVKGFGRNRFIGIIFLVISFMLLPVIFMRDIVPGRSKMQLVQPSPTKSSSFWRRLKLSIHLRPKVSAVLWFLTWYFTVGLIVSILDEIA